MPIQGCQTTFSQASGQASGNRSARSAAVGFPNAQQTPFPTSSKPPFSHLLQDYDAVPRVRGQLGRSVRRPNRLVLLLLPVGEDETASNPCIG